MLPNPELDFGGHKLDHNPELDFGGHKCLFHLKSFLSLLFAIGNIAVLRGHVAMSRNFSTRSALLK